MNLKDFLQKKGITEEAFKGKDASEQANLVNEWIGDALKSVEDKATKSEIEEIMKSVNDIKANNNAVTADQVKALEDSLKEAQETIKQQGERLSKLVTGEGRKSMKTLSAAFKEKYDEVVEEKDMGQGKEFRVAQGTQISLETKEIVSTDIMPVNDVSDTVFPEDGATGVVGTGIGTLYGRVIGFFGRRIPKSRIMDYVDVQPLTESTLIAINETWTGNAEVTPECELKPVLRMDFSIQEKSADAVAAMWFTTTKLRRFFANLIIRIEMKFSELVNERIPEAVLAAIRTDASAFTPNAALNITDEPNNYDALGAVIASIESLGYEPNAIFLHPIAWRNMKQLKNDEGIYLLSNGQSIQLVDNGLDWGGVTIPLIKDPTLGVDEFIVGDLFETVKVGVDSQLLYFETDGRVDTQSPTATTGLARNIRTHVLEKFVSVIIPEEVSAGVVRDTFSNVKTLIAGTTT